MPNRRKKLPMFTISQADRNVSFTALNSNSTPGVGEYDSDKINTILTNRGNKGITIKKDSRFKDIIKLPGVGDYQMPKMFGKNEDYQKF